ncbi:MAG: alanine--tRNA ligase [Fimbriimonadaceae bacterium]
MKVRELRQKYLDFFDSKGHQIYPSGSLVPFDVTGRLDESLLFNGAGMVQFKPFFRGVAKPPHPRLANSQKCVRTGDIEDVGDTSHLTFFEMLGNFSFGDYFKSEAIDFSWEFLTSPEWLGLDPARLAFTVFEADDEAHSLWSAKLESVGIDPSSRVFRLGEETNYWPAGSFSKGPPGPCGPNSEMFYWVADEPPPSRAGYGREEYLRDEAAGKWLEIWNDVFIQFEWQGRLRQADRPDLGFEKTGMPNLPFPSVDTGMGLERTAAALAGLSDLYRTDAFAPILSRIEALSAELARPVRYGACAETDRAIRIVADHIRSACFCIADGILPGNTGRGYVLRRLIRRAVLKGQRVLGFERPFFHLVFDGVREAMDGFYPELDDRSDVIVETLKSEESLFRRTLDSGADALQRAIASLEGGTVLAGATAFQLYDTYGFPLEVTRELCAEAGVQVDLDGFRAAMAEAQERSRGASGMQTVYGGVQVGIAIRLSGTGDDGKTRFLGYDQTESPATVVGAMPAAESPISREFVVALDQTPFYAESGGQVSDTGRIVGPDFELRVTDVAKQDGIYVHMVEPVQLDAPELTGDAGAQWLNERLFRKEVSAQVDRSRRARIVRNHTGTHLLHAALREVLGKHVTQAGSLVAPGELRFDFTHGKAMTPDEVAAVESLVNEKVLAAIPVQIHDDIPLDEARRMGAMALFGEKYGDRVRVVQVGDFSLELCGGIHVRQSSEIGLFKIVHESSAASGVRRIEAVSGEGAYEWARTLETTLRESAGLLKANPSDLRAAIERTLEQLREERKRLERLRSQSASGREATETPIGTVVLAVQRLEGAEMAEGTLAADRLVEGRPSLVALVAVVADGRVNLIAKVGPDAKAAGVHAGNLVREVAKLVGGGGGGRPDFATAGGKDPSRLDAALRQATEFVRAMVGA